jgi:hypothetical protein
MDTSTLNLVEREHEFGLRHARMKTIALRTQLLEGVYHDQDWVDRDQSRVAACPTRTRGEGPWVPTQAPATVRLPDLGWLTRAKERGSVRRLGYPGVSLLDLPP